MNTEINDNLLSTQMIDFLKTKYDIKLYKDKSIDIDDNGSYICTLYDKSDFFRFIFNTESYREDISDLYNQILETLFLS